jgi:hypothetical protein
MHMTDIVKEMNEALVERDALRESVAHLTAALNVSQSRCAILDTHVVDANALSRDMMAQRDHYMRQVVELMSACNNMAAIAADAAAKASHGRYRANGGAVEEADETLKQYGPVEWPESVLDLAHNNLPPEHPMPRAVTGDPLGLAAMPDDKLSALYDAMRNMRNG